MKKVQKTLFGFDFNRSQMDRTLFVVCKKPLCAPSTFKGAGDNMA